MPNTIEDQCEQLIACFYSDDLASLDVAFQALRSSVMARADAIEAAWRQAHTQEIERVAAEILALSTAEYRAWDAANGERFGNIYVGDLAIEVVRGTFTRPPRGSTTA